MPVKDLNAVKMGTEVTNVFKASDTTTSFWALNPELIAWVIIIIALLFLLASPFLIYFWLKRR